LNVEKARLDHVQVDLTLCLIYLHIFSICKLSVALNCSQLLQFLWIQDKGKNKSNKRRSQKCIIA